MNSLFEKSVFENIIARIQQLTPITQSHWGRMGVGQMMAHLNEAFTVPLATKKHKTMFIGYILGPLFKSKAIDDSKIAKNMKTVPSFKIDTLKDFEEEKAKLIDSISAFHQQQAVGIGTMRHPFFGKLTGDQWGIGMHKHVNYHLTQFGV